MTKFLLVLAIFVVVALCGNGASAQRFSEWSTPVNLGAPVNAPNTATFFPAISKDGLSLYFTANPRPDSLGGWDIYVSRRASVDAPWGPPENLGPNINTPYDETAPFLSTDGHRLYFESNRPDGFGGMDLYVSRRKDTSDDFGWEPAENLGSGVNTIANEAGPSVYEDDTGTTVLYFASDRPGGPGPIGPNGPGASGQQGSDIYMSAQQADGTFGPATLVDELSSPSIDRRPYVRRDGLEIFFSSQRPGTLGLADLWVSTRASTSDLWSVPVNLGLPVNGAGNDTGAALSFDGTTLYFQSVRPGNLSPVVFNLWVTTRTKLTGPLQ
jgi:hypothetical protein